MVLELVAPQLAASKMPKGNMQRVENTRAGFPS